MRAPPPTLKQHAFALVAVVAVVAVIALGAGCAPVSARIPGVLDLRSDGKSAALDGRGPAPADDDEQATRGGLGALTGGRGGVVSHKGHVAAEERGAYFLHWIPLGGEREIADDLLPIMKGRALREVTITDGQTAGECAFTACTLVIPGVDLLTLAFLPTSTLIVEGVRVVPGVEVAPAPTAPPPPTATPEAQQPEREEPEGGYER